MRRARAVGTVPAVSEPLIERDEVVALLFNVGDIVELLRDLVALQGGDDSEEEPDD